MIGVVTARRTMSANGDDAIRLALGQQHDGELVAGNARQRVLRPQQPAQAARQRQQNGVARRSSRTRR